MDVDVEQSQTQRVPELWFEDGNLVIQAGNSQFRVYRGILAARSPVFHDILSIPQPADAELVDSCSLRFLNPSKSAPYQRQISSHPLLRFFMPFPAKVGMDAIMGCLRLSNKYQVDYLRRRALIHMASGYPTTLSRWDEITAHMEEDMNPPGNAPSWLLPLDRRYTVAAVQLLREVDALWMLPVAFYRLCIRCKDLGREIYHGAAHNDIHQILCYQDQEAFAKGHYLQIQSVTTDVLRFLTDPLDVVGCTSAKRCARARFKAISWAMEETRELPAIPLDIWDAEGWEKLHSTCPTCLTAHKEAHQAARQAFWDKLPEIYALPPWEELKKLEATALEKDGFA
ncbi:hypothetical protein DFH07DRAFT_774153 [Mycena maculata]|uniref:BTB domain-containing protein n=1 Tax=Mycena maculata TaxID=230809 RepID=A0AAD7IYY7_9AGAR|nr:hypothetical protein DFH07DRAFT_774153 [Mycena maculata]